MGCFRKMQAIGCQEKLTRRQNLMVRGHLRHMKFEPRDLVVEW